MGGLLREVLGLVDRNRRDIVLRVGSLRRGASRGRKGFMITC